MEVDEEVKREGHLHGHRALVMVDLVGVGAGGQRRLLGVLAVEAHPCASHFTGSGFTRRGSRSELQH